MNGAQAAVLGAVQGAAEVVPVSSSAQLALLPWLLGWEQPASRTAFGAGLHLGSCAGIAFALRSDLAGLGRGEAAALLVSCLPAAAAGLVVGDAVERRLGGPAQLAGALGAAGALLWLADRRPQHAPAVRGHQLTAASVAQVAALVPGVSRQGAVLTALRLLAVERAPAARTALLMSLPVTAGAALLPLARADRTTLRTLAPLLSAGLPSAAVSGCLAASAWRRRPAGSFAPAAVYRLGLAAAVAARLRAARRT